MGVTQEIESGVVLAERFSVRDRLGRGGTATVFLAEDCVLGREVAIKRLHTSGSEADVRRFRREARLGASLMHPNLVTIFDTIESDDGLFIVMEYVRGRPLSGVIGADGMDPRRLLEILRPVASALDYAHEHGVVHRDVKPANILISDTRIVKLVDLGTAIADHATQITAENEVMGTLAYIAPERLAGESVGEPAADIYSLAVVAFEALTGHKPYRADSPAELLERVRDSSLPDLPEGRPQAPPRIGRALTRGMDADPDRRQASAGELVRDLEAALPNRGKLSPQTFEPTEPLEVAPQSQSEAAPRPFLPPPTAPSKRGRWLLPALAVAAIVVAAGGWLALSGGGDGSHGGPTAAKGQSAQGQSKGSASDASASTASSDDNASAAAAASSAVPPSSGTGDPETGAELNDQGYALIQEGNYEEAVPVLRRAVAAFPEGSTDINYAYALYNLGHALRMSGHPDEAIPILEERLQIPDQTATVQAELDAARAAAGE
ncbi:MAG: protein kinase domain-containing protein [Solirubrobacterales bacterium]